MKTGLPKGISRIVSPITGKVTFEVCAGVVGDTKIRKRFGEAAFGSEAAAFDAAESWYATKREKILSDRLLVSKIEVNGIEAVTEHFSKSIEKLEMAIKTSEQRILESFELILKAQKKEPMQRVAKLAWLFSLSVEQGKDPMDVFEDLLTAGLKGEK